MVKFVSTVNTKFILNNTKNVIFHLHYKFQFKELKYMNLPHGFFIISNATSASIMCTITESNKKTTSIQSESYIQFSYSDWSP